MKDAHDKLGDYKPWGKESDDVKDFDVAIKKSLSTLPALKQMQKMRSSSMKALRVSQAYVSYETELVIELSRFSKRSRKLLADQIKLIDACNERLEHNERKRAK